LLFGVIVQVHAAQGSHPKAHAARSYSLRLHACAVPAAVTVNGEPVTYTLAETVTDKIHRNTWHYDGVEVAAVIQLFQRFDVTADVVVRVDLTPGQQETLRPLMSGARGIIARARMLKPILDNQYPYAYPVRSQPALLCTRAALFCDAGVGAVLHPRQDDYDDVSYLAEYGIRMSYDPSLAPELLQKISATQKAAKRAVKKMSRVRPYVRTNALAVLTL
jgi:hypothetical protein